MIRQALGLIFRFASRALLTVVVLPALYVLWPFYRIRLGMLHTQRIGHQMANTETFLRRLNRVGVPPRTAYFLFGWDPANRQIMDMFLRESYPAVHLLESRWRTRLVFAWRPIMKKSRFWQALPFTSTESRLFAETEPVIHFTEEEHLKGRSALREMGIGENDWFVCFHARDSSYYRAWRPQLEEHWKKTDYINCRVENYLPAAQYITSLGGFAVRMGAVVETPLPDTGNPRIVDYATKFRTDFMDVYLCAHCRFFLGSSSGLLHLATSFGRPVITANNIVFNHVNFRPMDLMIPRLLTTPDGTRLVPFDEAVQADYHPWAEKSGEPTFAGRNAHMFRMLESEPIDILDVCKDMVDRLDGREPAEDAKQMQALYGEKYLSHLPEYPHGGNIGARFALKYRHLIVPADAGPVERIESTTAPPPASHRRTTL